MSRQVEGKPHHIYSLADPMDGLVKYIGVTINPKQRLQSHACAKGSTLKEQWISSLSSNNLKPVMEILETVSSENAESREEYWIWQFKVWGFPITNTFCDGKFFGLKGESHYKAVLTEKEVYEFYQHYKNGGTMVAFSKAKKMRTASLWAIVHGKSWAHLNLDFAAIQKSRPKNKYRKSMPVLQYDMSGQFIKEWSGVGEASENTGIKYSTLQRILCHKDINHTGGYIWKFKRSTMEHPEIQKKIEREAFVKYSNSPNKSYRLVFIRGGEFAASLYEPRIQELEKVKDHLEEGCNERDKRIQELEKEIDKCRSLLQKMVTDTNYTQVQETYDQITEYINYINSQK